MDTFLLTIAVTSLAAAAALAATTWRLLADDRRRTEARVAALGAAIDASDPRATGSGDTLRADLFDAAPPAVGSRAPLRIGAAAAMAVLVIVAVAMFGNDADTGADAVRGAPAAARAAADGQSLELLSMRYARVGEALTVSGLVRNAGHAPAGRLTAVVFAFDKSGGFLASGRAPLDFDPLAAGDESPFQVTIPHLPEVGRYRVSFRTEAGTVPHVDRRAEALRAAAGR